MLMKRRKTSLLFLTILLMVFVTGCNSGNVPNTEKVGGTEFIENTEVADTSQEPKKEQEIEVEAGIQVVRKMSLSKRIRAEIEYREKARRDRMAELAYARDEGIEQGVKQGIEQGLEQGIRQGIRQGIGQGIEQGQDMISSLNIRLIKDGRLDDLKRAAEDAEFRRQLLDEYEIKF